MCAIFSSTKPALTSLSCQIQACIAVITHELKGLGCGVLHAECKYVFLAFHSHTSVISQMGQHCRACRYDDWVHCTMIVQVLSCPKHSALFEDQRVWLDDMFQL